MKRFVVACCCVALSVQTAAAISGFRNVDRETAIRGEFDEACVETAARSVPGIAITRRFERGPPGHPSVIWAWSIVYSAEGLAIEERSPPNPRFVLWAGEETATPGVVKIRHSFSQAMPSKELPLSVFEDAFKVMKIVEAEIANSCGIDFTNAQTSCTRNEDCRRLK